MRRVMLLFLFFAVLVTACTTEKEIVCESPYIRFSDSCCLDANSNNICDVDEASATTTSTTLQETTTTTTLAEELVVDMERNNYYGNENAQIVVTLYSDATDSFTTKFYEQLINGKNFKKDYIDTGKVGFRFYHAPSKNVNAMKVARAVECASEQGAWFKYWITILKDQSHLLDGDLVYRSRTLNLDEARFESCLTSSKHMDVVEADYSKAKAEGYNDIHLYLIGDEKYTLPMDLRNFKLKVDAELQS